MFRVRTEKKCIPQVSHLFTAVTVLAAGLLGGTSSHQRLKEVSEGGTNQSREWCGGVEFGIRAFLHADKKQTCYQFR